MSGPHEDRGMDGVHFGRQIRVMRLGLRMRQLDVAARAGVSRQIVSRIERGQIQFLRLDQVGRVAGILELDLALTARGRGAQIDRLMAAGHASLQARVAAMVRAASGWVVRAEVGFDTGRERGSIDLLAWHAESCTLLVIEIKTEIVDPGAHARQIDRYRRAAPGIAAQFGWRPRSVGTWLVVADSSRNRRLVRQFEPILAPGGATDSRAVLRWLRTPTDLIAATSFFGGGGGMPGSRLGSGGIGPIHRVRLRGGGKTPGGGAGKAGPGQDQLPVRGARRTDPARISSP